MQVFRPDDYGYMYWPQNPRENGTVYFYTDSYAAVFDVNTACMSSLGVLPSYKDALYALHAPNDAFSSLKAYSTSFSIHMNDCVYELKSCQAQTAVTACGLYVNSLEISGLPFVCEGEEIETAKIYISSFPDYLTLSLSYTAQKDISACVLVLRLQNIQNVQNAFSDIVQYIEMEDELLAADALAGAQIEYDGKNGEITVKHPFLQIKKGDVLSTGLKLMPMRRCSAPNGSERIFSSPPLAYCIEAQLRIPLAQRLEVKLNRERLLYLIELPKSSEKETVLELHAENPFNEFLKLPIAIKQFSPFAGCPVITYPNGQACPLQIQSSCIRAIKAGREYNEITYNFILPLEKKQRTELKFTIYNWNFDDIFPISIYQLYQKNCVFEFNYGSSSFILDMNHAKTFADINEIYPLFSYYCQEKLKRGTDYYGSAQFLNAFDADGQRTSVNKIRHLTQYSGPLLAKHHISGITDDDAMEFHGIILIPASDDCLRLIIHLRCDFIRNASYSRLSFFSLGSQFDNRLETNEAIFGNSEEQAEYLQPLTGGLKYRYAGSLFSDSEWCLLKGKICRAMIVRSVNARLAGKDNLPGFSLFGTESPIPSLSCEINPEKSKNGFLKGDYLECELELMFFPQNAENYYGPNDNFYSSLKRGPEKTVLREAVRNNLEIEINDGELIQSYPPEIKAINNTARFTVRGGIGYIPVCISGVARPDSLYVNQACLTAGQCQYDAETRSYTLIYSVCFDDHTDGYGEREFSFGIIQRRSERKEYE